MCTFCTIESTWTETSKTINKKKKKKAATATTTQKASLLLFLFFFKPPITSIGTNMLLYFNIQTRYSVGSTPRNEYVVPCAFPLAILCVRENFRYSLFLCSVAKPFLLYSIFRIFSLFFFIFSFGERILLWCRW